MKHLSLILLLGCSSPHSLLDADYKDTGAGARKILVKKSDNVTITTIKINKGDTVYIQGDTLHIR